MNVGKRGLLFPAGILLVILSFALDSAARSVFFAAPGSAVAFFMKNVSYYGEGWSLALACTLLAILGVVLGKEKWLHAGVIGLCALLCSALAVQLLKHIVGRARPGVADTPFLFHGFFPAAGLTGFDAFPSGHAMATFSLAVVLGRAFPKLRPPVFALALLICLSRLYLEAHFLSDVVVGAFGGILIGSYLLWFSTPILAFMSRWEERRGLVSAVAISTLAVFLFFHQLKAAPLFDVDEAIFAETAREMLATSQPIVPIYNGAYRYDKPILMYWLIGSAFTVLGVNELAARFWSALAGWGAVLATFLFVRSITTTRCALLSAFILATSFEFLIITHLGITDIVLTFFLSSSLFCFFHALAGTRSARSWSLAGWALAAGAVLTKGPVGLVLTLLPVALYGVVSGRAREFVSRLALGAGIVLFCVLTFPWYIAVTVLTRGEFLEVFLWKHNIMRYLEVNSGHRGPWYYYVIVAAIGFAPWSAFLPGVFYCAWTTLRERMGNNPDRPLVSFVLAWVFSVFVFFSLSRTKLPGYLLPLFPALAILSGWWWNRVLSYDATEKSVRFCAALGGIFSLAYVALLLASPLVLTYVKGLPQIAPYFAEPLELQPALLFLAAGAATSAAGFFLTRRQKGRGLALLATSAVFSAIVVFDGVLPKIGNFMQAPLRDLARQVRKELGPDEPFIVFGLQNPSILFYSRQRAIILRRDEFAKLQQYFSEPHRSLVITNERLAQQLENKITLYPIARRGFYLLASNRPSAVAPK
jgi:4-amino-4-deoxy-L-arabinose transferase-like glycosyltransferase/membrane-associated phospholipid phosphatase